MWYCLGLRSWILFSLSRSLSDGVVLVVLIIVPLDHCVCDCDVKIVVVGLKIWDILMLMCIGSRAWF